MSTKAEIQLTRIRARLLALVPLDGTFGATDDVQRLDRALAAARREGAEVARAAAAELARAFASASRRPPSRGGACPQPLPGDAPAEGTK